MRRIVLIVALLWTTTAFAFSDEALRDFARRSGLADPARFAETVETLRSEGHLPDRYLTKRRAERLGWAPGRDLCRIAPGKAIGGDAFHNAEKRLPESSGRRWYEADLDTGCGSRGPKRLIYSNDGLQFVTVDHYRTFIPVP
jgi:hypothetical protein